MNKIMERDKQQQKLYRGNRSRYLSKEYKVFKREYGHIYYRYLLEKVKENLKEYD